MWGPQVSDLTSIISCKPGGGAVLLVPTPCMLVGGWSVKNFGKNQKYFSTFGHYLRDILSFLEHKISNFRAARAKNWIELSDLNKIFSKF